MAERYNFKYLPLVGKLPGKSMVEQTETAINELASVVYDNVGHVGNLAKEVQTANTNASNALDKATEALETSGRVYINQIAAVDVNDYYDSELYYINNDGSTNIPVRDRGFLEVKTNDDKTACEQVFIADSTGTPYYRHGRITEQTLGEETTYVVTWSSWYRVATTKYVQGELTNYLPLSGGTLTGVVNGVTPPNGDNSKKLATTEFVNAKAGLPVGFQYFQTNPNVPAGSLPLLGGEYSRTTYADLWAWVQTQSGYLLEESAWQAKAAANGGNVPFYSKGDGSTTFRVPALKCWVRGANSINEVGGYLAAGLPNITGMLQLRDGDNVGFQLDNINGAFSAADSTRITHFVDAYNYGQPWFAPRLKFSAHDSSSIYGNSDTVQPPSIVGMWVVKAYGTVTNVGSTDVSAIAQGLTEAETRISTVAPTGVVQAFSGSTIPAGWLLCDGSAVSRTTYASLYACIGTTYGAGNGSTTFNLPNLTDKFIQGSGTVGTVKAAGLPNITGGLTRSGAAGAIGLFDNANGSFSGTASRRYAANNSSAQSALTMRYIIKY